MTPKSHPRSFWNFAIQATLSRIHAQNEQYTWHYLFQRRDRRRRYIHLWKLKKQNRITMEDEKEFDQLENALSVDDIRFFRSLAEVEMKREGGIRKKEAGQSSSGWMSWWYGDNNKESFMFYVIMMKYS
jgi:vacuolar protein sorting-associated protein 13A/C